MQGDWMSSLKRLSRCADPSGLVKKVQTADIIRLSYPLLEWFHKALRLLIRLLQTSQWDIDFPAPLLQPSQFSCLIDWWPCSYCTCSVVLQSVMFQMSSTTFLPIGGLQRHSFYFLLLLCFGLTRNHCICSACSVVVDCDFELERWPEID